MDALITKSSPITLDLLRRHFEWLLADLLLDDDLIGLIDLLGTYRDDTRFWRFSSRKVWT